MVVLAPLRPDVAFLHVDVADEAGNSLLAGPTWVNREMAGAAKRTVVLAEEVVPAGSLDPDAVAIPGPLVTAVVHVPFGAYPTAVVGRYDYDRAHIELYVEAAREGGDAYARYLDEYVYGVDSHQRYLERAGLVG